MSTKPDGANPSNHTWVGPALCDPMTHTHVIKPGQIIVLPFLGAEHTCTFYYGMLTSSHPLSPALSSTGNRVLFLSYSVCLLWHNNPFFPTSDGRTA